MDLFIAVVVLLLSIAFVLIIIAAKGTKTKRLEENRRAARRYDGLL
jgi:hypothetical protein